MTQSPYYKREKWTILRGLWLAAFENAAGDIKLETNSPQEARSLRSELYRAVRRVNNPRTNDHELLAAAAGCSITIPPGTSTVIIYKRYVSALLHNLNNEAQGVSADASAARLQEQLTKSGFVSTPPLSASKKHTYF